MGRHRLLDLGGMILLALFVAVMTGCTPEPADTTQPQQTPTPEPESSLVGEPLPGSFHLTADPAEAPFELTVRVDDIGGPSGRSATFEAGDHIELTWATLPIPLAKWIEMNGQDCVGTFGVRARMETDLVLSIADGGCRIEVLGSHREGDPHVPRPG